MTQQNINLAYCLDNRQTIDQIVSQLSAAPIDFHHFHGDSSLDAPTLSEQLADSNNTILLVVSDNFLKSPQCMGNAIELLQKKNAQILTIVADGIDKDPNTGDLVNVETNFDRVSDIIKYINYWQDKYLELRRKKKQLENISESQFNANLKKLRDISSDVGEFLRLLRSMKHVSLEQFEQNDYELFFQFVRNMDGWETYKQNKVVTAASKEEIIVEEIPTITSDEPLLEAVEEQQEVIEEQQEETVILPPSEPQEEPAVAIEEEPVEEEENDAITNEQAALELVKEGLNHFDAGRIDEALNVMAQAIEFNPNDPGLRYHYALMLIKDNQDLEGAKEQLERVVEIEDDNIEAYKLLGKIAEQNGSFTDAKQHYEKVLELDPSHPGIFYKIGNLLLTNFGDQKDLASTYFMQAIKNNPKNAYAAYKYASLLHNFYNNKPKAIEYYNKVLDIAPDHPQANFDIAEIYLELDNVELANQYYHKAVTNNPDLKTAENDEKFAIPVIVDIEEESNVASVPPSVEELNEEATIEVLKQYISRLEHFITVKKEKKEEEIVEAQEPEPELPPLKEEVVLITGATAGIGKATAEIFAQNNYRLIINGRRIDRLEEIKADLEENFHTAVRILPFDVTDRQGVEVALSNLEDEWSNIDILINNAGKAKGYGPIHSGDFEHWEEMIDTNIKGLLYLTRLVAPQMVERATGHIINVCSIAGKEVYPMGNVYCATKHAVDALTKAMRLDLFKHNIRVSQVSPAMVEETEFAVVRFDGDTERAKIYEDFTPLKSSDVAEAIFFMANRPSYVNIQDIVLQSTQQANATMVDRSGRKEQESNQEEE